MQGTDVKLKDIVRNHDFHVITHNKKCLELSLQKDCLAALPQILVKAYEPFAMSRFHYGALLSDVGDFCCYKENHEVVMTTLNDKLDETYLTIQCSKRVLASDYRYNFHNKLNQLDTLFADVKEKHLLHSIKPLQSQEEIFAPYVEKKQQLPTTTTIQGTMPENT